MELSKAIEGIHRYRELIHKEDMWNDPISLSDTMTKLAVYNSYIADNIAPLHKKATDQAYKAYIEAKTSGETASYSEQLSRGKSTDDRMLFENTQNIYRATTNLITVIQTRLKVIENQRKQEGIE